MDKQKLLKLTAMVSITGTIAFFSYKFGKRLYLDYKEYKEGLEGSIDASEIVKETAKAKAQEMVDKQTEDRSDTFKDLYEEAMELDDEESEAHYDRDFGEELEEVKRKSEEMKEELMDLRHDPNSVEALEQFKQMKLAEFDSISSSRLALLELFEVPYAPSEDLDETLGDNLVSKREQFFGYDSVYNTQITVADLLLYFAELLTFEVDGSVVEWCSTFLNNIGYFNLSGTNGSKKEVIDKVQKHYLIHNGNWGIFGLSEDDYFEIAEKNNGTTPYIRQMYKWMDNYYGI